MTSVMDHREPYDLWDGGEKLSHPLGTFLGMEHRSDCSLQTRRHGDIETVGCATCATVEWFRGGRPVVADVALASLFGEYDLVARLDAVRAPGREVLLYRAARGRRDALTVLPEGGWFEVAAGLFASHDGHHLLLSPVDPVLTDNLTRGA